MSVLNVNQFLSKECPRFKEDYKITPQKEWVYGDGEMIFFARRYLKYWKERMGFNNRKKQALFICDVSNKREVLITFLKCYHSHENHQNELSI